MPRNSIIIPTCKDRNLIPCLESIHKYTDLSNTEIIIVANGYEYEETEKGFLGHHKSVIWFDKKIGYPAAVNAGIQKAKGEFLILLNDDTQLLEQPKNQWIELLCSPFNDPQMAITGPWMVRNTEIDRDFLIFFCVMIRKSVLDQIGLLDAKAFGFGYGEDVDLCCRAVDAGYKIAQVPVDDRLPYDGRIAVGQFPIYHEGNVTFKNWPGGEELMARNHAILRERYDGVFISNAQKLGEYVSDNELRWLGRQAKKSNVVIELGSWFGKSATVIADNLPPSGVLYCIDTWAGSEAEKDTNHADARKMDGDYAYDQFCRNLQRHIVTGKVRTIRMHGRHGTKLLKDMGVQADFIFIDAGHTYREVQEDIRSLLPLRKQGGVISGHDYMQMSQPEVTPAVLDIFGHNLGQVPDTTIWATDAPPIDVQAHVYDCFTFNNEFDLLEKRLETMWPVVDRFVIVEATVTHSGKPKQLQFHNNLERFSQWLSKITYIVVEDSPPMNGSEDSAWAIERHQRDAIMRGLTHCKPNDIIIVSDVDEIPNPEAIKEYSGEGIASLEMELYLFDNKIKAVDPWYHAKIVPHGTLLEMTPCGVRYAHEHFPVTIIKNGGQHLSYFGGVESIQEKIHNTAHRNIDTPEFTDPDHIRNCIENGLDLFNRNIKYEVVA